MHPEPWTSQKCGEMRRRVPCLAETVALGTSRKLALGRLSVIGNVELVIALMFA